MLKGCKCIIMFDIVDTSFSDGRRLIICWSLKEFDVIVIVCSPQRACWSCYSNSSFKGYILYLVITLSVGKGQPSVIQLSSFKSYILYLVDWGGLLIYCWQWAAFSLWLTSKAAVGSGGLDVIVHNFCPEEVRATPDESLTVLN